MRHNAPNKIIMQVKKSKIKVSISNMYNDELTVH